MATVNIGNLSFTHKGDYDGSTAYSKNDVVYYSTNGNAYIAKQATTGNVPTNATYWNQFAQGSGGIWNAGLSLGTAGQVVKVNSGASALEFGTISSDYVKIARYSASGVSATSYNFENIFDATVYSRYNIIGYINKNSSGSQLRARYLNGSTAYTNANGYHHGGFDAYRQTNNSSNTLGASNDGDGRDMIQLIAWGNNTTYGVGFTMTIEASQLVAGEYKFSQATSFGRDDSSPSYVYYTSYGHHTSFNGLVNGIQFYTGDGNGLGQLNITIYGEKI